MMEWTEVLRCAIYYMEEHLLDNISAEDVAESANVSGFYFQKGFKIMTGFTVGEYLRNRRLYLAALDIRRSGNKVIDLACRYGYDTPESFTKAFKRFHGSSPAQIKQHPDRIQTFLPLTIFIEIRGGDKMDYRVEQTEGLRFFGMERRFTYENSYEEIPKFWDEFSSKYAETYCRQLVEYDTAVYGICIESEEDKSGFRYLIAGKFAGESVPEGLTELKIPALTWAKFKCTGPIPGALQTVNTRIFSEWLPENKEFELAMGLNLEYYSKGDTSAEDYASEIWIPVKKKEER